MWGWVSCSAGVIHSHSVPVEGARRITRVDRCNWTPGWGYFVLPSNGSFLERQAQLLAHDSIQLVKKIAKERQPSDSYQLVIKASNQLPDGLPGANFYSSNKESYVVWTRHGVTFQLGRPRRGSKDSDVWSQGTEKSIPFFETTLA